LKGKAKARLQTLRLYARLLQPIVGDAPEADGRRAADPGLLSAFNTATIRVVLMAQEHTFVDDQSATGNLPKWLGRPRYRPSIPTILAGLSFRSIPEEAKTGGFEAEGMDWQRAGLKPDSQPEAVLRSHAILCCRESCQRLSRALKAVCRMAGA
jgi:hypothetical protein